LLQAKQTGLLPSVKVAISTLETQGMWLSPALYARAVQLAGE
jgi:predicted nucleic acid-binding protein